MTTPRLDLVVGCNGAGKSSLIREVLLPRLPGSLYVNADDIAQRRWPDDAENRSYDAARIAERTRDALIVAGKPFIAETVFSHPSKLELVENAHRQGFRVVLHVVVVPEELAVHRVRLRRQSGGHAVPEQKIRARYQRVWPLAAEAITRCEQAYLYDNSRRRMRRVARFVEGIEVTDHARPAWFPAALSRARHP
ncbi:AAA family ATPase [Rhodococcus triatomae]|uniref:UDP-N-acetylglucosamine kinase n=1 Tax=Rhodococcus triatomae TaxID=300028 RepID=A0A1G8LI48_9NOCA|nr:zeta toxin family protein [Rhodococcus triatomae]QNG20598.1 AAA family ATPase [Rhodococcus triatomae]QNG23484.1 AAA family ATPase [Rhodococcus triatomae]SDI55422.1 Predicted ABC-type ATPase [Rhodococcus triatomae]